MIKIRRVDWSQAAEREAFMQLSWQTQQVGCWVPPLKAGLAQELSPDNLFFRHGEAAIFVAESEQGVVGRIVASVDHQLTDQQVGHFGYFEALNDPAVAQALLQAAEDWLRQQGKTQMHGPVNLSIYHNYRAQTSGFETSPFLGEPRNPDYYPALFEAAGLQAHAHWNSWDIPAPQMQMMAAYMQQKGNQPSPYTLQTLASQPADKHLQDLHRVAMPIFAENYGFAELDFAEFQQVYAGLLMVFQKHPDLVGVFYEGQEPVAFGFVYPDYSGFFEEINGDVAGLAGFQAASTQQLVFHTFGILKAHRQSVIAYQMFNETFRAIAAYGFQHIFGALAKEGRSAYDQLGKPTRSYAIFAKDLS